MAKPPEACTFPGQNDDEIVQRVIYKHIFSVLPVLLVAIGLFLVGLVMLYAGAASAIQIGLPSNVAIGGNGTTHAIPLASLGLIVIGLGLLIGVAAVYVWRQNKMLVTDENVVDVDQMGVFRNVVSTLRLSRVQDVSVDVKGPMQTLFKYGTINIQTAGEKDLFDFDYVPNPYEVKAYVQDMFEQFVENKPGEGDGVHSRSAAAADDDE